VVDLLICAATLPELQAFGEAWGDSALLLTGVGIPAALAAMLDVARRKRPKRILNIGIAGAYPKSGFVVGDIVLGTAEVYGDVGFELQDAPGFRAVSEASWGEFYRNPLPLTVFPEFAGLTRGRGCTVNTCTGTEATGNLRERLFEAAFETMEGAAVAQAGQMLGIPVCEIRAISNIAARRDMQPQNIQLATDRLREYFSACREKHHA